MKRMLIAVAIFVSSLTYGQLTDKLTAQTSTLPSAPVPQSQPIPSLTPDPKGQTAPQAPTVTPLFSSQVRAATQSSAPLSLTLQQAEALALKNNPLISVAQLTALASQQVTREARSALWPTATANLTGVDAEPNSRITAGGLNNPIIYDRAAAGVIVSQLITDFGRTKNLVSSADLSAKAAGQNAVAGRRHGPVSSEPFRFDQMRPGCWDIDARIRDMDINGVWASLNFPSMITGFCGRVYSQAKDPELGLAVTRARRVGKRERVESHNDRSYRRHLHRH